MGLWHLVNNRLPEAEASFKAALASNPRLVHALNNLAIVYERSNRKAEAIRALERALDIDPTFEEARKNLERLKGQG